MDLLATCRRIISESTIKSAIDGRSFVRIAPVAEWLTTICTPTEHDIAPTRRIDDLYSAWLGKNEHSALPMILTANNQIRIFCILYEIDRLDVVDIFRNFQDDDLPLSLEMLNHFGENHMSAWGETDVEMFYRTQWPYCPVTFELAQSQTYDPAFILPIGKMDMIGAGNTARVYEVVIPKEYLGLRAKQVLGCTRPMDGNVEPDVHLVMKTFETSMSNVGRSEARAYQLLQDNENFVRYLCDFEYAGKRSILLEQGEYDLYEFFASYHPPILGRDIVEFWRSLSSIVKAVEDIQDMKIETRDDLGNARVVKYSGYHGDIKPDNILRVRGRWKLLDPSFASLADQTGQEVPLRKQPLTYAPPEAAYQDHSVISSADIWSLGCVFSIAATWIVLGSEGIAQYTAYRIKASEELCSDTTSPSLKGDFFHNGSTVLPQVTQWHEFLRQHARKSDNVTREVLDMVDELMFVDWRACGRAKEIHQRLLQVCREFAETGECSCTWSEMSRILKTLDWREYELPARKSQTLATVEE